MGLIGDCEQCEATGVLLRHAPGGDDRTRPWLCERCYHELDVRRQERMEQTRPGWRGD